MLEELGMLKIITELEMMFGFEVAWYLGDGSKIEGLWQLLLVCNRGSNLEAGSAGSIR